jgi:hypothetical protein
VGLRFSSLVIFQKLRTVVFVRTFFLAYPDVYSGVILLFKAKDIVSHQLSFLRTKLFKIKRIYAINIIFNYINKLICQLFLLNY